MRCGLLYDKQDLTKWSSNVTRETKQTLLKTLLCKLSSAPCICDPALGARGRTTHPLLKAGTLVPESSGVDAYFLPPNTSVDGRSYGRTAHRRREIVWAKSLTLKKLPPHLTFLTRRRTCSNHGTTVPDIFRIKSGPVFRRKHPSQPQHQDHTSRPCCSRNSRSYLLCWCSENQTHTHKASPSRGPKISNMFLFLLRDALE